MSNERRVMLIQPFCLFVVVFCFFLCTETRKFGLFEYDHLKTVGKTTTTTTRILQEKQHNTTILVTLKKNTLVQWMVCVQVCVLGLVDAARSREVPGGGRSE